MLPLVMAGIMAAAGLLKGEVVDREKEERERKLAADTQRYSPWTGLKAGPIHEADPFGQALQGGFTGYSLGTAQQSADADNRLKAAQEGYLRGASPYEARSGEPNTTSAKDWKGGFYPDKPEAKASTWSQMRGNPTQHVNGNSLMSKNDPVALQQPMFDEDGNLIGPVKNLYGRSRPIDSRLGGF